MGKSKKVTASGSEDDPPAIDEEQGRDKEVSYDPNTTKSSEAKEQRFKELQEQLQAKQKGLEECRAHTREKSLR